MNMCLNKYNLQKTLLLILFILPFKVNSLTVDGCDASYISKVKSEAGNVNIAYNYYNDNGFIYFKNIITNITPNMYFVDSKDNKVYTYNDTINGEITLYGYSGDGNYKFYTASSECMGRNLITKYYKFPKYNYYYDNSMCLGILEYPICNKWASINYSYEEMQKLTDDYRKSLTKTLKESNETSYEKTFLDRIADFYVQNYYYVLIGIIIALLVIMYFMRRKYRFG